MAAFKFRLEKLLTYRRLQEEWAKDAYQLAVANRIECEREIAKIQTRKADILRSPAHDLESRRALESYVVRLDDEIGSAEAARGVLETEEERALDEWNTAKQAAQAIEKLREGELDQWKLDETRREQAELDEWSVFRRAS